MGHVWQSEERVARVSRFSRQCAFGQAPQLSLPCSAVALLGHDLSTPIGLMLRIVQDHLKPFKGSGKFFEGGGVGSGQVDPPPLALG